MPNVKITDLPAAQPLTGFESVPIVQDGITVRTTTAAISASPSLTQTFLTLNQEPTLPNSRSLSGGTGIGLVDGGALSTLQITLNGASGSLEVAGNGLIAKTGSGSVVARSVAVSGDGLAISNGNGVSGDPTLNLDGLISAIAQVGGTGLLAIQGGSTAGGVEILGTADQIEVVNGNGSGGNPVILIADNAILPGTGAITIPVGNTAQEPVGANGQIRFNSDTQTFDGYASGNWRQFSLAGGVTSFNGGSTGLTPASPTTGAITLGGTLNVANGGTGATTLTGYVKGNGTSAFTASSTIPTSDLSGTISNAQLANSSVTYNGVTVSLGGSGTISAATTNPLTSGTGLQYNSGTTFDGSVAKTISIDSTVATLTGTQILTNKTISGSDNTLTNIGNGSLTNSSVTINGSSVSLGGSITVTATATNALTIGTGLSGTSYNGSAPVTIAIDSSVVTLTGSQTLTNKTLTTPVIAQISNTGVLTLPTSTDTLVGRATTDTLTNKSISGSTNTLTNIPNSALTNSSVTIGTTSIALGASSLTLGGLTSVAVTQDPTLALQLATKQYVDSLAASGIHYHDPVYVEVPNTTGNLNATYNNGASGVGATLTNAGTQAAFTADGISVPLNSRVLIYNQTNQYENGVYTLTTVGSGSTNWVLTRATDANTYSPFSPNSLGQGDAFFVTNGNTGAGETYICNTVGTITFGTTAITFAQISSVQVYSAGTGLTLTGTQFSITNTGVSAATYGSASAVPVFAVNAQGQLTSVTNTTIAINGNQVTSGTVGVSYGGTGLSSGTSGGVLYFSGGTTLASSGVLAANALVIGGGAGVAPSTTTTGTGVLTALGTNVGSAGAFVVNGGALGTPSSGTVTNLTGTASININGTVGATTPTTGAFTTISASGVITSTVATGTAPFTVASTTQVANLNAATAGTATNATNTAITANSTNATNYLTFVSATTGNLPQLVNSSITCNPSTGKITAGIAGGTF